MYINYQKLFSIKCVLADVKKSAVADSVGVDQTILSREIKNASLISKIDQYFDSINPKINVMVARLLSGDENNNYQTGSFNQAGANEQHVNYGVNTDLINEKNKTIERLEGEVEFLRKMLLK